MTKIRVVELFAGVGGFRLGLEGWQHKSASSHYNEPINSPYQHQPTVTTTMVGEHLYQVVMTAFRDLLILVSRLHILVTVIHRFMLVQTVG